MNRRTFLKASTAGLAISAGCAHGPAVAQQKAKRVGVIGPGWFGKGNTFRLMQVAPVNVAALCDVDARMLAEAADRVAERQASGKRPTTYGDYREMLKKEDLDIVIVGTPDHWHALPAIAAMQAGADVYVEKPICVDVVEGQAMLAAARKYKRVVQVGTQRRSTPHIVDAKKHIIEKGLLGKIGWVETCCYHHGGMKGQPKPTDPPEYLDYEMWTGPAPLRPYIPGLHPRSWRSFMEYGNGTIGDMGIHMFDMVRWLLGLGWPKRVSASGGLWVRKRDIANIPDTLDAAYDYDDLTVVWTHRRWGSRVYEDYGWAAILYGDRGTLKVGVKSYDFEPARGKPIHKDYLDERDKYPEDTKEPRLEIHAAPANRRHMQDFLQAIATRGRPVADIEEGFISSACCILGNLAMQLGRTLVYDPEKGVCVGDDEATGLLARPYRKPWVHPTPENV
jgi:predicted dehydrogenase